jgi:hypothetical protein
MAQRGTDARVAIAFEASGSRCHGNDLPAARPNFPLSAGKNRL